MKDSALAIALDICFVAVLTVAAEVWMIGLGYLFYRLWSMP